MEIGYGIFIVKHLDHKDHVTIEVEKPKIFFKLDNALKYAEKRSGVKSLRGHAAYIATFNCRHCPWEWESYTIQSPLLFDILGIGLGS